MDRQKKMKINIESKTRIQKETLNDEEGMKLFLMRVAKNNAKTNLVIGCEEAKKFDCGKRR